MYLCRSKNYRETKDIVFQKEYGHINPLSHLKACIASADLNFLQSIYKNNVFEKKRRDN